MQPVHLQRSPPCLRTQATTLGLQLNVCGFVCAAHQSDKCPAVRMFATQAHPCPGHALTLCSKGQSVPCCPNVCNADTSLSWSCPHIIQHTSKCPLLSACVQRRNSPLLVTLYSTRQVSFAVRMCAMQKQPSSGHAPTAHSTMRTRQPPSAPCVTSPATPALRGSSGTGQARAAGGL